VTRHDPERTRISTASETYDTHPEAQNAPLLRIQHATVIKGHGKRVLDDISLEIREGEHTAILGPNGSGKSSLLKLITRDYYPLARDGGDPPVTIFGRDRWDVFTLRSLLGIVSADLYHAFTTSSHGRRHGLDVAISGFFASHGLFPHHEVTDDMRRRAAAALALMGASHLAERSVAELSTGEVRRLLIARALVPDPRALLLDEPTAGLDLLAMHRFLETLGGVAQRGKTLILVTHHVEEILPEIERVILLKDGQIFLSGPKRDVLTSQHLSELFDAPIRITESATGYYAATIDA
jgi:iron complex transport system ATP-binding protein